MKSTRKFALVPMLVMCAGCSTLFPTQFPSAKGTYEFSGEKSATIIFDSDAVDFSIRPAISLSERSCEEFKSVGYIFKHSTLTRLNPLSSKEQLTVTRQVPAGPIQVLVLASQQTPATRAYCTSNFSLRLNAEEGATYRVFLSIQKDICDLRVTNDREPGKEVIKSPLSCGRVKVQ